MHSAFSLLVDAGVGGGQTRDICIPSIQNHTGVFITTCFYCTYVSGEMNRYLPNKKISGNGSKSGLKRLDIPVVL